MRNHFYFYAFLTLMLGTEPSTSLSVTFRLAASSDDIRLCQALRHQIFVQEQNVPVEAELDGKDDDSLHVMCWHDGTLVATGRCLAHSNEATLGRIAVHENYRGQGIGRQVIRQLERYAAENGATRVSLTPHEHLYKWYCEKLGYRTVPGTGRINVNAQCTLIQMEKILCDNRTQ